MAFGQQSGPPSSAKQVAEITELLEAAGYSSLREARHPFDLTQRQANGKFTQGEASELIERLVAAAEVDASPAPTAPAPTTASTKGSRRSATKAPGTRADRAAALAVIPAEALADELVSRGWVCIPPS